MDQVKGESYGMSTLSPQTLLPKKTHYVEATRSFFSYMHRSPLSASQKQSQPTLQATSSLLWLKQLVSLGEHCGDLVELLGCNDKIVNMNGYTFAMVSHTIHPNLGVST
jgi:hypothetical protein